jgi:pyruvate dehydrogenase E2 component (dihydrolipoamide acetyltransferase)
MEVEAFHDGFLAGPLAAVDQELPVGDTIGYIADTATEAEAPPPASVPIKPPAKASATETAAMLPAKPLSPILAAAEANRTSGGGWHAHQHAAPANDSAATDDGLLRGAEPASTTPGPAFLTDGPPYNITRASSLREAVARTMIASAATPTFRVTALLSLGGLVMLAKEKHLSLTLLFARACARSIAAHPLFNAAYTETGLAQRDRIDIGIAVDSPDGLITPVLRDVGMRSLTELGADWQALRDKVKSRRLAPSDYRGATFYVSDLGVFPVVYAFDSLIPAGASAILSVATNRAEGAFCTLNCDHRVIFGGDAARFLQTLADILLRPEELLEEGKKQ